MEIVAAAVRAPATRTASGAIGKGGGRHRHRAYALGGRRRTPRQIPMPAFMGDPIKRKRLAAAAIAALLTIALAGGAQATTSAHLSPSSQTHAHGV